MTSTVTYVSIETTVQYMYVNDNQICSVEKILRVLLSDFNEPWKGTILMKCLFQKKKNK